LVAISRVLGVLALYRDPSVYVLHETRKPSIFFV